MYAVDNEASKISSMSSTFICSKTYILFLIKDFINSRISTRLTQIGRNSHERRASYCASEFATN